MNSVSKVYKAIIGGLVLLLVFLTCNNVLAQGTWTTKASMPRPQAGAVAGVINGQLYVMGGNACSNPAGCGFPPGTAYQAYNPATDTWATKASAPTPRAGAGADVINNKLYVVGGCINTDCASTTNILEVYDPATDTWASLAPMPTPRSEMFVGAINGKLYVAGGTQRFTNALTTLEVYDPATNTWDTTKRPMPIGQAQGTGAVVNGNLYVIGGFDTRATGPNPPGPFQVGTVQAYDPVTDSWSTKAAMPTARRSPASGVVNNLLFTKLYVVGGAAGGSILSTNEAYDPLTNSWTTEAAMPTARFGLQAGVINGVLYAAGGANSSGLSIGTNEAFTPAPTQQATTLTFTAASATTADFHDAAQVQARLTTSSGAPVPNETVTFTLGSGPGAPTCSASTDVTGTATCLITPNQPAGTVTLTATFAGDASFAGSSASTNRFTVTKEETTLKFTATSPTLLASGQLATFSATLKEDGVTPISGRTVTITLGSGAGTQSCAVTTDSSGTASCTITVNQPLGPNTVTANFASDAFFRPSSDTEAVLVFAFLGGGAGGSFVIGDGNAAVGSSVTFWSAQWAKANSLSGGPAPAAFKGFASHTSTTPPTCGGTWTTPPGNSSNPPATVPSLMVVIAASSITKSGTTISGNIPRLVIVKTNPGYGPAPGHTGTGTVVAVLCGP